MSNMKELATALEFLAETMSQVEHGAWHLTCTEARSIEDVLRASGYAEAADAFIEYHAHGDDDEGDEHHARYRELNGLPPIEEEEYVDPAPWANGHGARISTADYERRSIDLMHNEGEERFHYMPRTGERDGMYGIEAVVAGTPGALTCGTCGKSWARDITPAGRCPWEYDHKGD